ncbi:MAG: hypothetical protein GJ680_18355 [Alteromonadaceae bacterium]|nr:hypothetical protein [Alteromonadaceae bacterium]
MLKIHFVSLGQQDLFGAMATPKKGDFASEDDLKHRSQRLIEQYFCPVCGSQDVKGGIEISYRKYRRIEQIRVKGFFGEKLENNVLGEVHRIEKVEVPQKRMMMGGKIKCGSCKWHIATDNYPLPLPIDHLNQLNQKRSA